MRWTLLIALIVFTACGEQKTKFEDVAELETYLNDAENGFIVSQESADMIYEAKLTPSLADDKNPQFTVHLRIKRKDNDVVLDSGGANEYEVLEREGYLAFEVLKDIAIEVDGQQYPAVFHHYERNYGLKPSIDMLFNFQHIDPESSVHFVYRDELFGQGLTKIEFSKELFNKCYVEKA